MENTKIIEITVKQLLITLVVISAIIILCMNISKTNTIEMAKQVPGEIAEQKVEELVVRTTDGEKVLTRSSSTERQAAVAKMPVHEIDVEEINIEVPTYKKIEEITISKDMDLTVRTGISKEDFKTLISKVRQDTSKFFYDNSDVIYDLCEEYQINEIFFCGLISAESGWNIATSHRNTHNYISLMSKGKLIRYNSVEEGLRVAAQKLHDNYLTEGGKFYYGKTLSAVKTKFCPASTTWVNLVYGRMEQIINSK